MARTDTLGNFLTDVADAIRTKKGSEELIAAADFDTEIENLPSGADLSEYFSDKITYFSPAGFMKSIKKLPAFELEGTSCALLFAYYDGEEIDLSKFDTSQVTNMGAMFQNCKNVKNFDVSKFNTSNVTQMNNMFQECNNLESIDVSSFNTEKVTTMASMFKGCPKLKNIDMSSFNTPVIFGSGLDQMFYNDYLLENIDMRNITAGSLTQFNNVFSSCRALKKIDMRSLTFDNITAALSPFGYSSNGVPSNCEIIVKSQTEKDWVLSKRNDFTNVKTVAEYEAEQNPQQEMVTVTLTTGPGVQTSYKSNVETTVQIPKGSSYTLPTADDLEGSTISLCEFYDGNMVNYPLGSTVVINEDTTFSLEDFG